MTMLKEAIFTEVFNLLHSLGQINRGKLGGSELCRRLAKSIRADSSTPGGLGTDERIPLSSAGKPQPKQTPIEKARTTYAWQSH